MIVSKRDHSGEGPAVEFEIVRVKTGGEERSSDDSGVGIGQQGCRFRTYDVM